MGNRRFFLLFGGCEGMGTRFPREGVWRHRARTAR
jgi:hypothetical protein